MNDNNQTGRSISGKGYYIALILCAAAIGITGYLYARNEQTDQTVSVLETVPETVHVPALATQPPATEAPSRQTGNIDAPPQEPPKEPTVLKTAFPLEGQELAGYCVEALSYNETTRDWRTHAGIDLAAEEGEAVCAAADGTVYTTYEDEALGHTVVIRHPGGYTTRYSSLTADIPVKAGDNVTLGQPIGTAGTTALVESALGPHVHFSVTHQDKPMDPAEFFSLS